MSRRHFVLTDHNRRWIASLIDTSPVGHAVTIGPALRTLDQNAIFHALCDDIARARPEWKGLHMDGEAWKALLIVSHAVATQEGAIRLVPDLEGLGLVQLRESSARMSKERAASLISYTIAWAVAQGIELREAA